MARDIDSVVAPRNPMARLIDWLWRVRERVGTGNAEQEPVRVFFELEATK
jgi:hypothetical protein